MNVLQIEVATYARHSAESLDAFVHRQAGSGEEGVLGQHRDCRFHSAWECTCRGQGCARGTPSKDRAGLLLLVGRLDGVRFQVVQVFPKFRGPQEINLDDALASSQVPVAAVKRGMSSVAVMSEKPVVTASPFLELR